MGRKYSSEFRTGAEKHMADFFRVGGREYRSRAVTADLLERVGDAFALSRELHG